MNKQVIPKRMFYRVFLPSCISALTLAGADIADALVVGVRVGETGLAAIGIVTPLYMLFNLIGYGFSTGGSITHGRLSADGELELVHAHFKALLLWLLGLSFIIVVAGNALLLPFLSLLGVGADYGPIREMCVMYARPMLLATPVFMLNFILYDFVRCDNDPALASLGFSIGCIVDFGLNIFLVLMLGMGVIGSILATITAQTVSVLVMLPHLFNSSGLLNWRGLRQARSEKDRVRKACRSSLRIGFSTSIRYIFQFLFLAMGNRLLLRAGDLGLINGGLYVAVFDLVMNVSYVAMSLYQASSDTMQPLASIFSEEHDTESLRFILRLALTWGIGVGAFVSALLALFAGPVAGLFGLAESTEIAVPAIRIFCLSTPFAGFLLIQIGYDQSCGNGLLSGVATLLRTAVLLLPVTFIIGWFFPAQFWWLFPLTECLACLIMQPVRRKMPGREMRSVPVFSASLDNEHRDLETVMEKLTVFCEENEIEPRKAVQIQLAVEELCLVTLEKAFTGEQDEYIQLTLVAESQGYILHIRNSAPFFNPLDMRMEKIKRNAEEEIMDSMGVMLVRKTAKDIQYRNYEGCNVLTVIM